MIRAANSTLTATCATGGPPKTANNTTNAARQIARRQRRRRLDLPPALLPVERVLVVRQRPPASRAPHRDHQPPLPAGLPHRQRDVQHAGIPASLRLQSRTTHGQGQRLPRVVNQAPEQWQKGQFNTGPFFHSQNSAPTKLSG